MKKILILLVVVQFVFSAFTVSALYETTVSHNEKYASAIETALNESEYGISAIDVEKIYIIEKNNKELYESNTPPEDFYVAMPITGTKDIVYGIFRDNEYVKEARNSASMLYVENYMNTRIDEYLNNNGIENVREVVNTVFNGRTAIHAYLVKVDDEDIFIPYYVSPVYNPANDESCALVEGKAYSSEEFLLRLENEKLSFEKYREAEKQAEEERHIAEENAEKIKYTPVVSLDENGDETVKINGISLQSVLYSVNEAIEKMKTKASFELRIDGNGKNYLATYRREENADIHGLKKFAVELFDELTQQVEAGKPDNSGNASYFKIGNIKVIIRQRCVEIHQGKEMVAEFRVKNYESIIDILDKYGNKTFSGFTREVNDEETPDIRGELSGITVTDIIEFDFMLPDNKNSISEITGEVIKGNFKRYKESKYKSIYVLTLGRISFYKTVTSSLSGEEEYFSNNIPVSFNSKFRVEDGRMVEYTVGQENYSFDFKMIFSSGNIREVYIDGIKCENLKYVCLTEDTGLSEKYAEKNKEVILKNAKECADDLYNLGLFKGTDKGYELDKGLTREESAVMLVRLLGKERELIGKEFREMFSDVKKDRWSFACIMYCYEEEITKGTGSNKFSPEEQIDSMQFTTLIMRLLGYKDVTPENALDFAVEYQMIPADKASELTRSGIFRRSDMVQLVYNSLKTRMKDETLFCEYLMDEGILSENDLKILQ